MSQKVANNGAAIVPRLTFLGAAQNVTGSRYLLEAGGSRILVDCDEDTVLLKVRREGSGNVCHTGERTCFSRELAPEAAGGGAR